MAAQTWVDFCKEAGIEENITLKWKRIIENRYGEPWRHYHTLSHIERMLGLLRCRKSWITDNSNNPISEFQVYMLSIYFHDIVYDPRSNTNELDSIVLFDEFNSDVPKIFSDFVVSNVRSNIRDTISHRPTNQGFELFLDFDLEILSATSGEYQVYAENIRKEYHFVQDYSAKRTQVMEGFLKRVNLYFTKDFANSLNEEGIEREKAARTNISNEIAILKL